MKLKFRSFLFLNRAGFSLYSIEKVKSMETKAKYRYVCNHCQNFFKTLGEAEAHMSDHTDHAYAGYDDLECC